MKTTTPPNKKIPSAPARFTPASPRLLRAGAWGFLSLALTVQAQWPAPDSFNPGANSNVAALALQPDGKVLVGGGFTNLGGLTRNYLARIGADGTTDADFDPGANGPVNCLALQPDGKIVAGGQFTLLGGQNRTNLGRLNPNGTLDTAFNLGANSNVLCLAVQADGKILVGGQFTTLGGISRSRLARINTDGSLDTGFSPAANSDVNCLAVQADGKILVGGLFTTLAGTSRSRLGRLNTSGTLDTGFNPAPNNTVFSLSLRADGRVTVLGLFTTIASQSRGYMARLNTNGTLDTTFTPTLTLNSGSPWPTVQALQADGKIVIGGALNGINGQSRPYYGRLNGDGTLDTNFFAATDYYVDCLAVQPDGKTLVAGTFTLLGGQPRANLGRLNSTDPPTLSLASDGSSVTWTRGGTSPEVGRVSFDYSTDGATWTSLGAGTWNGRVWQLTGTSLPDNAILRARGYATGGYYNGCGWFVETIVGPGQLAWGPYLNNRGTTNIVVRWRTQTPGTSRVRYGLDPDHLDFYTDNPAVTSDHVVALTGLQPETRYYYSIGSLSSNILQGPALTFVTAPPIGASRPTRVWFLSDFGYGETNAQAWVRNAFTNYAAQTGQPADLWLTGGDNDQHDGSDYYYTNVFNCYPDLLCCTPLFSTLGNHDLAQNYSNSFAQVAGYPYFKLFSTPTNGEAGGVASGNPSYYSFNHGDIHFVSLNSVTRELRTPGSAMLCWLTNDLAGTAQRWKIAFWHDPPYTKGTHNSDDPLDSDGSMCNMRALVLPLLESYGVDLVLCGHSHVYERTFQLQGHFSTSTGFNVTNLVDGGDGREDGTGAYHHASGQGTVYVVAGVGSNPMDGYRWYPQWPHPAQAVFYQGTNMTNAGSCILDINEDRLDFRFLTGAGTIGDHFTLLKTPPDPALPPPPTGLAASGSPGPVVLSWLDYATNETGYVVERADASGFFQEIALLGANVNGYLDSSAVPTAQYSYRVRARGTGGDSVSSETISVMAGFPALPIVPLVQELFDGVTNGGATLHGQGGNLTSSLGFYRWSSWSCNSGKLISTWLYDLAVGIPDTLPGLPPGQSGQGGLSPAYTGWDTGTWAVRPLDPSAYVDFGREQLVYFSTRLENTGDTAVGFGFANGSAASSSFVGVGAIWNTATGLDGQAAGDSLYVSDGLLNQSFANNNVGPYAVRAHTAAGSVNAKVLVAGRLRLHPTGADQLDVKWYGPGAVMDSNVDTITWDLSYSITNRAVTNMLATNLLVWLNGTGNYGGLDAIRVGRSWKQVTGVANISGTPQIIAGPAADSPQIIPGRPNLMHVEAEGAQPLFYQWRKDGVIVPEATNYFFTLSSPGFADRGYYDVVVSNSAGTILSPPQEFSFNLATADALELGAPVALGTFANSAGTVALQPDGKVIIGGNFLASFGGEIRSNIARFYPDGTLDTAFNPAVKGTGSWPGISFLALDQQGRILVGGSMDLVGLQTRSWFGRLNPDGSLDTSFTPNANSSTTALAFQPDGKILVSGSFSSIGGQNRSYLARLNNDGTLDASFAASINSGVRCMVLQTNGQILIGGDFTTVGGQSRLHLARLNANGSLDATFSSATDGTVFGLLQQTDGRILVGGWFTALCGRPYSFGRLLSDGTLDTNFFLGSRSTVFSAAQQVDGRLVLGGSFTSLADQSRLRLGRVYPNGALDSTFSPSVDRGLVNALALQPDGKIVVGGDFDSLAGAARHGLGRLNNSDPAVQSLVLDGSTATWSRSGTCPAISRASLASSMDGTNWTNLGSGTLIPGGWQWTGLSVAAGATLRAQGYTSGGFGNNSSWFIESGAGPTLFLTQPTSQYASVGQTIVLSAHTLGSEPVQCQWRKDGAAIEGATASSLNILGAPADADGAYDLVVSNGFGVVTSATAVVTMMLPASGQGHLLVQELFDGATNNVTLNGQGANLTSSLGFVTGNAWSCNAGAFLGTYNDANAVAGAPDTLPGLPPWQDGFGYLGSSGQGGKGTNIWATRYLAANAFDYTQDRVLYFSFRLDNTGDTAMGLGFANLSIPQACFIGVGAHWESMTGLDGQPAGNSLYISDGRLDQNFNGSNAGPYAVRAHTDAGTLNGPALVVGRLTWRASDHRLEVKQYSPGSAIDSDLDAMAWSLSYPVTNSGVLSMAARYLLVWINGEANLGRLDAIRVGNSWKSVTGVTRVSGPPQFVSPISVSPTNVFLPDQPVTLSVEAEGAALGYQWRRNSQALPGANASALVISSVPETGNYDVVLSNAFGMVTSAVVTVYPPLPGQGLDAPGISWTTGGNAPWFTQTAVTHDGVDAAQSGPLTARGQSSWLRGTVTGQVTLTFWWKVAADPATTPAWFSTNGSYRYDMAGRGNTPWEERTVHFSGGTNYLTWWYRLDSTNLSADGYSAAWVDEVTVTNDQGQPPSFLFTPSGQTVPDSYGIPVLLRAGVAGQRPMNLQWRFNGAPLSTSDYRYSGVDSETLEIPSPCLTNGGDYQLVASNAFGVVTSAVVAVTAYPTPPLVYRDGYAYGIQDQLLAPGAHGWLTISPAGTPPFAYQWTKDGAPLPGKTNATCSIDYAKPSDSGPYQVVVANAYGQLTSAVARVVISDALPVIDYFPGPVVVLNAGDYFNLYASAHGPEWIDFRWQKDGLNIPATFYGGDASAALSGTMDPTNSGAYRAQAWNNNGDAFSPVCVLAVAPFTPLAVALNIPQWPVTNDLYAPWVVDTTNSHDGWVSAQAPPLGNWNHADFSISVTGPTNVSFWWQIQAVASTRLVCYMDGAESVAISGTTPWQQEHLDIPDGPHTLSWSFVKQGGDPADTVWVDEILFGVAPDLNVTPITQFGSYGSLQWFEEAVVVHNGPSAWQSGPMPGSGWGDLDTFVTGPGLLSFWWKGSSDSWSDSLFLLMDGAWQFGQFATFDWTEQSVMLPAGDHFLQWYYNKNSGLTDGAAWVADVILSRLPGQGPLFIEDPAPTNQVAVGETLTLAARATSPLPITYSLMFHGAALRQHTDLAGIGVTFYLGITNASAAGDYTVQACDLNGCSTSAVAAVFVGALPEPPPRLALILTDPVSLTLSWPVTATGWVLERAAALDGAPGSWILVPPPYQTNASVIYLLEPATADKRFYRLSK